MDRPLRMKFELVREMGGELIILDPRHDVAHRLSPKATAIWRACDGMRDSSALAAHAGLEQPQAEQILVELRSLDLLEDAAGQTRRNVLRKAMVGGAAVVGASTVTSVLVPTAAQAFSSMPHNQALSSSDQQGSITQDSSAGPTARTPPGKDGAQEIAQGGVKGTNAQGGAKGTNAQGGVKGATRTRPRPVVAGASRKAAGGGATGSLPTESLPFTGRDIARTAALGGGLIAAGALGRSFAGPPPER